MTRHGYDPSSWLTDNEEEDLLEAIRFTEVAEYRRAAAEHTRDTCERCGGDGCDECTADAFVKHALRNGRGAPR